MPPLLTVKLPTPRPLHPKVDVPQQETLRNPKRVNFRKSQIRNVFANFLRVVIPLVVEHLHTRVVRFYLDPKIFRRKTPKFGTLRNPKRVNFRKSQIRNEFANFLRAVIPLVVEHLHTIVVRFFFWIQNCFGEKLQNSEPIKAAVRKIWYAKFLIIFGVNCAQSLRRPAVVSAPYGQHSRTTSQMDYLGITQNC